jgi:hypothetical protein
MSENDIFGRNRMHKNESFSNINNINLFIFLLKYSFNHEFNA